MYEVVDVVIYVMMRVYACIFLILPVLVIDHYRIV
jgi:hypothetical protein